MYTENKETSHNDQVINFHNFICDSSRTVALALGTSDTFFLLHQRNFEQSAPPLLGEHQGLTQNGKRWYGEQSVQVIYWNIRGMFPIGVNMLEFYCDATE